MVGQSVLVQRQTVGLSSSATFCWSAELWTTSLPHSEHSGITHRAAQCSAHIRWLLKVRGEFPKTVMSAAPQAVTQTAVYSYQGFSCIKNPPTDTHRYKMMTNYSNMAKKCSLTSFSLINVTPSLNNTHSKSVFPPQDLFPEKHFWWVPFSFSLFLSAWVRHFLYFTFLNTVVKGPTAKCIICYRSKSDGAAWDVPEKCWSRECCWHEGDLLCLKQWDGFIGQRTSTWIPEPGISTRTW